MYDESHKLVSNCLAVAHSDCWLGYLLALVPQIWLSHTSAFLHLVSLATKYIQVGFKPEWRALRVQSLLKMTNYPQTGGLTYNSKGPPHIYLLSTRSFNEAMQQVVAKGNHLTLWYRLLKTLHFRELMIDQDFLFQKLRMAVEQHVERLEQKVQELQEKLFTQEQQHQKQLSRRPVLYCKICFQAPDHWRTMLYGHMTCESCMERDNPKECPVCGANDSGYIKCYPFAE